MKIKQILIAVGLIAILLAATTLVASAKPAFGRITGGINYPYDLAGWAWAEINITFDPVSGDADGFLHYKSYTVEKPKDWGGWIGEAICADLGEFNGLPAVSLVVQVVDGGWTTGYYAKFIIADGGLKGDDWVGLSVWDLENGPVPDHPGCEYQDPFYPWPSVNGNLTVHMP